MRWERPVSPWHVTSAYGKRIDPLSGRPGQYHPGLDLRAKTGADVVAVDDGQVLEVRTSKGDGLPLADPRKRFWAYGNIVTIRHGTHLETRYAHLDEMLVHAGEDVKRGQLIGRAGASGDCTGPHLHFEARKRIDQAGFQQWAPLDPAPFFAEE